MVAAIRLCVFCAVFFVGGMLACSCLHEPSYLSPGEVVVDRTTGEIVERAYDPEDFDRNYDWGLLACRDFSHSRCL